MGVMRRLSFTLGLIVGLGTIAAIGIELFAYLFTGKIAAFEMVEEKPRATLMTSDEVVTLVKKQMPKGEKGEQHGEA